MAVSGFQTIYVVDGTAPWLVAFEAADIRAAGGNPIVVFGMSNGLNVVMRQIAAAGKLGNVMLLPFGSGTLKSWSTTMEEQFGNVTMPN